MIIFIILLIVVIMLQGKKEKISGISTFPEGEERESLIDKIR